ncbi:MAG: hypothetical protein WCW17_01080 [Patescibacteria group bacterium]|jgi:DNA repair exonuclease SbcCD ATPase subunit
MAPAKKVSEKNTKQEIWRAYDELMSGMNTLPIEFSTPKKEEGKENFIKDITDLKLTISDNLDKIANNLLKSLNDAEIFRQNLENEKNQILENIHFKKDALEKEIENIKNGNLEQEKEYLKTQTLISQEKEIERKREENEYIYNLATKRRKENDEYQTQKATEIAKIQEREEAITIREKEIAEMEKSLAEMPKVIEESVFKSNDETRKELTATFTAEISRLKIESEHQKNISDLNTKNLESTIKTQETEINSLKNQLSETSSQLKEMAVAVIEGGSGKDRPVSASQTL